MFIWLKDSKSLIKELVDKDYNIDDILDLIKNFGDDWINEIDIDMFIYDIKDIVDIDKYFVFEKDSGKICKAKTFFKEGDK